MIEAAPSAAYVQTFIVQFKICIVQRIFICSLLQFGHLAGAVFPFLQDKDLHDMVAIIVKF